MKARDKPAVSALRSALAAIDNAEAVRLDAAPAADTASADVAGAVAGVGSAEVPRRDLSPAEVHAVVRNAISERETAAAHYHSAGRTDAAEGLRYEVQVLSSFVDGEQAR